MRSWRQEWDYIEWAAAGCPEPSNAPPDDAGDIVAAFFREHQKRPSTVMACRERWAVALKRELAAKMRAAGYSYPEIGAAMGGLHHTSVMYLLGAISRPRVYKRGPNAPVATDHRC